jgi:primase-polymerase (primpol)-like protein
VQYQRDENNPHAVDQLRQLDQWVVWKAEVREGKVTKVPYTPGTARRASSARSEGWSTFAEAERVWRAGGADGIGFVFTAGDPFAGVDLDDCRDPQTGVIEPWAEDIIRRLDSYTEGSPSGTGVKIFLKGSVPGSGRRKGRIEMYSQDRYFTVTGLHLPGTPAAIEERGKELLQLHDDLFGQAPPPRPARVAEPGRSAGSAQRKGGFAVISIRCRPEDDGELIRQACEAANGAEFKRLWEGKWEGFYPSQSEADLALCHRLAYWTDGDLVAMDRLFRRSGLMRPKWDEDTGYGTYGYRTLLVAQRGY